MSLKTQRIIFSTLIIVFLAVFIWSGVSLLLYYKEYRELKASYENAQTLVQIETVTPVIPTEPNNSTEGSLNGDGENIEETKPIDKYADLKIKMDIDWDTLSSQSSDVIGWIYIPNTTVNYPLVHKDNVYYLDHDYTGKYTPGGAIFMDARLDMSAQNVIIFGHNMQSNTMFHGLRNYRKQETAIERRYVYIATPDGTQLYEVFAAGYVQGGSDTYTWDFSDAGGMTFDEYIEMEMQNSVIDMGVTDIKNDDKTIMLSTCSGRADTERFVVHAVLRSEY